MSRVDNNSLTLSSSSASTGHVAESNASSLSPGCPDHPLLPGQFRLFYLESTFPENCHGRSEIFDIEDAPTFRALSYVCGNPYQLYEIVNGCARWLPEEAHQQAAEISIMSGRRTVNIIINLFNALSTLATVTESGWIWVDALCIQQDDLAERATQVALMGQIYTQAKEVLIWLGHEIKFTSSVVELVRELRPALLRTNHSYSPEDYQLLASDDMCKYQLGISELPAKLADFVLFGVFCRWFQRFWVTQELVLAGGTRVFCGSHELKWGMLESLGLQLEDLEWMNVVLAENQRSWDIPRATRSQIPRLGLLRRAATLSQPEKDGLVQVPLPKPGEAHDIWTTRYTHIQAAAWLSFMRQAACSDARDRIYAAMGIVKVLTTIDLGSSLDLNYVRDFGDLYTSVASLLLQNSQSLDLLAWAHKGEDLEHSNLPSWVPDYRKAFREAPLYPGGNFDEDPFNAAEDLPICGAVLEVHEMTLFVQGLKFDVVASARETLSPHHSFPCFAEILGLGATLESERCGGRPLEIMWRTCITDCTTAFSDPDSDPMSLERGFLAYATTTFVGNAVEEGLSLDAWNNRFAETAAILAQYTVSDSSDDQFDFSQAQEMFLELQQPDMEMRTTCRHVISLASRYQRIFNEGPRSRPYFVTERGLLGLGSRKLQAGDQIWVLAGAHTPYILRPTEAADEYRVVGDCFILNHMHGEILGDRYGLMGTQRKIKIV